MRSDEVMTLVHGAYLPACASPTRHISAYRVIVHAVQRLATDSRRTYGSLFQRRTPQ